MTIQPTEAKPVGSPASHGLVNGSARRSMGQHAYTPQLNSPALSNAPPATQPLPGKILICYLPIAIVSYQLQSRLNKSS